MKKSTQGQIFTLLGVIGAVVFPYWIVTAKEYNFFMGILLIIVIAFIIRGYDLVVKN